jgi:hypothetical protein
MATSQIDSAAARLLLSQRFDVEPAQPAVLPLWGAGLLLVVVRVH